MQFHSSYKCAETSELNFFHENIIYITIFFRQTFDSNKSVQIWRERERERERGREREREILLEANDLINYETIPHYHSLNHELRQSRLGCDLSCSPAYSDLSCTLALEITQARVLFQATHWPTYSWAALFASQAGSQFQDTAPKQRVYVVKATGIFLDVRTIHPRTRHNLTSLQRVFSFPGV